MSLFLKSAPSLTLRVTKFKIFFVDIFHIHVHVNYTKKVRSQINWFLFLRVRLQIMLLAQMGLHLLYEKYKLYFIRN